MQERSRRLAAPPTLGFAALLLTLSALGGRHVEAPLADSPCGHGGDRIAVAALGDHPSTEISALAGRAPYYLLFETDSSGIEVVPNGFSREERGAGANAAHLLSTLGVDCLVAGAVGPKMRAVLDSKGIAFYNSEGHAGAAVADILELASSERVADNHSSYDREAGAIVSP